MSDGAEQEIRALVGQFPIEKSFVMSKAVSGLGTTNSGAICTRDGSEAWATWDRQILIGRRPAMERSIRTGIGYTKLVAVESPNTEELWKSPLGDRSTASKMCITKMAFEMTTGSKIWSYGQNGNAQGKGL